MLAEVDSSFAGVDHAMSCFFQVLAFSFIKEHDIEKKNVFECVSMITSVCTLNTLSHY